MANQGGWSAGQQYHPMPGDRSHGVLCVGGAKDGHTVLRGQRGIFYIHGWIFFGKMIQHHRTECDLSAGHGRSSAPVLTWRTSH